MTSLKGCNLRCGWSTAPSSFEWSSTLKWIFVMKCLSLKPTHFEKMCRDFWHQRLCNLRGGFTHWFSDWTWMTRFCGACAPRSLFTEMPRKVQNQIKVRKVCVDLWGIKKWQIKMWWKGVWFFNLMCFVPLWQGVLVWLTIPCSLGLKNHVC